MADTNNPEVYNTIEQDELPGVIELYILEYLDTRIFLTPCEGGFTWDGNFYNQFPIEITGIEKTQIGSQPRPQVTVANLASIFSDEFKDNLIGSKLTRIVTFDTYENTDSCLPINTYLIEKIIEQTIVSLTLELKNPFDLEDVTIPSRKILGGQCPWKYKGAGGRKNLIASDTDNPEGGCIFPRDNLITDITGDTIPVWVNTRDEYIYFSSGNEIDWANTGVSYATIFEGETYFTLDTAYKIDSNGRQEATPTTVKRYWQCSKEMTTNFGGTITPPSSDAERFWQEYRVRTPYSATTTYNAYSDPAYNEYVTLIKPTTSVRDKGKFSLVEKVSATLAVDFDPSFSGASGYIYAINLNTVLDTDEAGNILNSAAVQLMFSNGEVYVEASAEPNQDASSIYSHSGSVPSEWTPLTYQPSINTSSPSVDILQGNYVIYDDGTNLFLLIGHNDVADTAIYDNSLSVGVMSVTPGIESIVYQVKSKTLDPTIIPSDLHRPVTADAESFFDVSPFWVEADQCSKSLKGCKKRFHAAGQKTAKSVFSNTSPIAEHFVKFESSPGSKGDWALIRAHIEAGPNLVGNRCQPNFAVVDLPNTVADNIADEGYLTIEQWVDGSWTDHYFDTAPLEFAPSDATYYGRNVLAYDDGPKRDPVRDGQTYSGYPLPECIPPIYENFSRGHCFYTPYARGAQFTMKMFELFYYKIVRANSDFEMNAEGNFFNVLESGPHGNYLLINGISLLDEDRAAGLAFLQEPRENWRDYYDNPLISGPKKKAVANEFPVTDVGLDGGSFDELGGMIYGPMSFKHFESHPEFQDDGHTPGLIWRDNLGVPNDYAGHINTFLAPGQGGGPYVHSSNRQGYNQLSTRFNVPKTYQNTATRADTYNRTGYITSRGMDDFTPRLYHPDGTFTKQKDPATGASFKFKFFSGSMSAIVSTLPSAYNNFTTGLNLPFGGFPGSRKFK